jgi:hypothetical protein
MSTEKAEREKKFKAALPRMALGLVHMVMLAVALRDLTKRPEDQINGNKRMWYGIVFVQIVGPVAYFLVGRKREGAALPAPESLGAPRLAEA